MLLVFLTNANDFLLMLRLTARKKQLQYGHPTLSRMSGRVSFPLGSRQIAEVKGTKNSIPAFRRIVPSPFALLTFINRSLLNVLFSRDAAAAHVYNDQKFPRCHPDIVVPGDLARWPSF